MFRTTMFCVFCFFISNICAFPQSSGLRNEIAVLENRTMGGSTAGFGSSFLWIDPRTHDSYLVSNDHVTNGGAHTFVATFQSGSGERVEIEDIELIFTDKRKDLALLSIGQTSRKGLKLSLLPVEEGITEVWSAGFPALGITPVFQLSRGYITNSAVAIIPHGELLQHDAAISAASSGGPLLTSVKTLKKDALHFAVIGVNAMTARDRPNTFFAIPSSPVLANFIERALKQLSPEAVWEEENNNGMDTANVIPVNTEINGTLNPLGDEDWYRLDIPAAPEKPVDALLVVKGSGDFSVEVYGLNGETVQTVKNTDGAIQFQTGTTVFIKVKQELPYFDVYALTVLPQE